MPRHTDCIDIALRCHWPAAHAAALFWPILPVIDIAGRDDFLPVSWLMPLPSAPQAASH